MDTNSKYLWETAATEYRLTQNHHLALAGKTARNKRMRWVEKITQSLREEILQWQYLPQLQAPDLEIAWIIHSHIAWKGSEADPADLYAYLPETDPARIMDAETNGPETESLLPTETIRMLHSLLIDLEKFGVDIKDAEFSRNWGVPTNGASKGKNGMPKGREATAKEAPKTKPVAVQRNPKPTNRKKDKLLADFFELQEKG